MARKWRNGQSIERRKRRELTIRPSTEAEATVLAALVISPKIETMPNNASVRRAYALKNEKKISGITKDRNI
jgi:hypothetical protein